jgi:ribonuclease HI
VIFATDGEMNHFLHSYDKNYSRQAYIYYLQIFTECCKNNILEFSDSAMAKDLGKECVKKIALVYLAIILVPLNISADIIFFKDGMKTVCHDRAWEEDGEIKCEYSGSILTYQKNDVLRIEKIKVDEDFEKPLKKSRAPTSAPAKQPPAVKQTAPKKELQKLTNKDSSILTKGLKFYNPRRTQKYWTSATAKHNTFKEAVAALAKQYDRSPDWIQHHMGDTNDLDEIHANLNNRKLNAPTKIKEVDDEKAPEILFYNPRRPQKYWTSATAKHHTFKEAISALAKAYDRSQEWVQQHMGDTNNLNEIHQNLAHHKSAASSQ